MNRYKYTFVKSATMKFDQKILLKKCVGAAISIPSTLKKIKSKTNI